MPPKKSAAPPPQSDESDGEKGEAEKTRKKVTKPRKRKGEEEGEIKKAGDESSEDDENFDLFAFSKTLPDPPAFLKRRDKMDRLMILNVEVNNFKSYFGKASIGPFHKSFTSIIGPNGSGKSNLIDSLLFVFGFRANKIRSDKLASLIHKSPRRYPDFCSVTIHFQRIIDGPDNYEVVPDSIFTITRTVYKNGNSSYNIDGRACSKAEVESRLRLVDIDIEHNRFLILQGEVEQIALMKPVKTGKHDVGMVEYLEDIVGSNRIAPYTRKFQKRVDRLNCEVSQQRIARDHARSSKIAMEGPVRTAIEFLCKENEAKIIVMKLDQRRRKHHLDKIAPQQAEIDSKVEEVKAISQQILENQTQVKELEEREKNLSNERTEIDKEFDVLTKEVKDLLSEETRRKDKIKNYEADITKAESDLKKEEKKKANFVSIPEKAEEKIKNWKEEVVQLTEIEETANAVADKNLEEFEKRSEKPKEEQRKIQEVWSKSNSEFNKIRSEATVARDEYEDMKRTANSGTKKLDDLKARLVTSEEKQEKDKQDVERITKELESCRSQKKEADEKLPVVKKNAKDVFEKLNQSRDRMNTLKKQNESKTKDSVVKMLQKEKEDGRIPSFVGRLGEMGVVDKKYETAISTVWPGKEGLEILIVEKQEDCTKVINTVVAKKIEKKHAARSLEMLNKNTNQQKLKPVPIEQYGAKRVFDLIDCDDSAKPAFYAMTRDTLIVDTFNQAVQLNKNPKARGNTITTLNGTVIAPTGNVTGGGERSGLILTDKNKKPKQVTQKDLDEELEESRKVNELQAEFDKLRAEEQRLDRLVHELRYKFEDLNKRLSIMTTCVETGEAAIETLKKTIESLQKEADKVKVDVKDLEAKQKVVEELDKKRDELSEKANELEKRQGEIQSELDGIFKELVQNHRDEAKNALQKRQKLEKEMAKEVANVSNSARNIAKCDENIERFENEIEKKRKLCEELQETAVDEEAIEAKNERIRKLEEKKKELGKEQSDLTKKQSELSAAETQLELDLKQSKDAISELKAMLASDAQMVKEIDQKLSGMKINRIPRFQFLEDSSRPEDVPIQTSDDLIVDENQTNEEVEKQKKHIANRMADVAYAKEFEMRQKVLENVESCEDVDGDKLIPVTFLTDEQVSNISTRDKEEMVFKLKQCEQQIEVLKQKVDLSSIEAYINKLKEYNEQVTKLSIITEDHRRHNLELQRLKQMRLEEFHEAFEFIGNHLVAVYKMLTDGGDAKLEYIDKDDPFRQGISFMVRPAKKAWKQIQFLSGGEKTLSSLALIFALHMFRPTPFYVMDEIDAALDYRNVSIIAQYVRQKTENAQFIIISLRNNMFELANRLVGIYKVDGCTKNVAIDPQKVCEMAKLISESLGHVTCTLPEEVTQRFNESLRRQNKELTAQEKQYPNFPSSSEISKAEKIVSVEGRVRKEYPTNSSSRPQSKATEGPNSTRAESRANRTSGLRSASQATPRTPRKERNNETDETTPPVKRSHSTASTRSPGKLAQIGSAEKKKNRRKGNEDDE